MRHHCLNPRDRSVEDSESRDRSHDVVLIRGKGVHSNVRCQSIEHRAFLRTQYNTCIDQDTDRPGSITSIASSSRDALHQTSSLIAAHYIATENRIRPRSAHRCLARGSIHAPCCIRMYLMLLKLACQLLKHHIVNSYRKLPRPSSATTHHAPFR
jgi:hypothetical protein